MKTKPTFFASFLNLRKAKWKWLVSILFVVIVLYGAVSFCQEVNKISPAKAIKQSLFNTLHAQSYRFQITASRIVAGRETLLSDLQGEKGPQGLRLQGSLPLIKADVDIYYLGNTLYRKDSLTQDWVAIPIAENPGIEQLIAELNPLAVFNFTDDNFVAKYVGTERVRGKKCRVYEVMTKGENKYLELFWQDFNYILWVDKKGGFLRQAQVAAEHRDDSQHHLKIRLVLKDYNVTIDLKPPICE